MTNRIKAHITGRFTKASGGDGCLPGTAGGYSSAEADYTLFNRHGGVSRDYFTSLNVGLHLGDSDGAVRENRKRVKENLNISRLLSARQVHGVSLHCCRGEFSDDIEIGGELGVDTLLTNQRGVGLMIQHADCQPVLLFDPVQEVIGAVHCGWRGSVQQILQKSVAGMASEYGSKPENIQAIIGPSLGPCCGEFKNYKVELPEEFYPFMVQNNYFDFWNISRHQLELAGLLPVNISAVEICTACSADYFSYRRACHQTGTITGRNCSVIALT